MEKTIQATVYIRPYGQRKQVTISDIDPEDAEWIIENKIKVGLEDCGFDFAIFIETGRVIEGEVEELTFLAKERTCRETIKEAVMITKKILET